MKIFKDFFNRKKEPTFQERLEKNELIFIDKEKSREATVLLLRRAVELDIPVVAGNQDRIYFLKKLQPNAKIIPFANNFTKALFESEDLENGVLIDESIASELTDQIIMKEIMIRGGFELRGNNNEA